MTTATPTNVSFSPAPSPQVAPALWEEITLTLPNGGQVKLPPSRGEGRVWVEVEPAAKVKQKQSSGSGTGQTSQKRAQKSETTVESIEPAKVTIRYEWTDRIHDSSEEALYLLNPNGPNGGLPVHGMHPELHANEVDALIIEKFGKKKREGGWNQIEIGALEWNPPPPPAPGDTAETPTQVGKWVPSFGASKAVPGIPVNVNASSFAGTSFGGAPSKGFSGPNAPKANP